MWTCVDSEVISMARRETPCAHHSDLMGTAQRLNHVWQVMYA
ncbi:Uncharacterised protein [Chlamydia trachomatis]|nr:Uncharacterised protein [Chlamydia trachomatis]